MPEKLGEDAQKIESEIESFRSNHPIFSGAQGMPQATSAKKTKHYRKRGRQRTTEKVKRLFVLYRIPRGKWPDDLDYEMCLYYTVHYIREDGKFHDIFLQWKAESEALHGKRFRVSVAIRPKVSRSRSKVLPFPSDRAAGES